MFHEADDAQRVEVRGRDGQGRHSVATRRDETARFCRFAFPRRQEARLHVPRVVAVERAFHQARLFEVFEKLPKAGGWLRQIDATGKLVRGGSRALVIFAVQELRVHMRRRLPEQDDHVSPASRSVRKGHLLVAFNRIAHA